MSNEEKSARMAPSGVRRRLAAILAADVKGYSRLMGEDEVATLRSLTASREVTDALIAQHHGRIVGTAGDSILAEFASVVDAVQCAVEIQRELKVKNAGLPEHRRMEFRIGINLGDVMVEGEQIYGDGVNVAARLEALADAGGICISGVVYEQIKNKLTLSCEDLGEQSVKNIAEPVRVWRVALDETAGNMVGAASRSHPAMPKRTGSSRRPSPLTIGVAVAGLGLLVSMVILVQYLSGRPQAPSAAIPPAPPLPLPDKPSIAVLPFTNLSGDAQQDYFGDGIAEDLITDLSKLSGLFVISRNSTFTYKGKAVKLAEVSKELGVQYVLEGSVRRAENQVRVTAQLVDATTDHHLWAERYDRSLQDIFTLQDEIRQKIMFALKV
ncbi:MAG TPA: adenylate/guanylate cyclase domain-containing protein, partial [Candidatus Binatia bacterium]|nr:adenylate/guanylate cyclase domain-containing protein [Candidatus Binatia bacterium]